MARTKGAKNKMTIAIKDAVEHAFSTVNRDGQYLVNLSKEHPQVFCALVSKCIPAAVAVDVKIHAIDLGNAMLEASQRLKDFNAKTIEHTPNTEQLLPIVDAITDDDQPTSVEADSLELSD